MRADILFRRLFYNEVSKILILKHAVEVGKLIRLKKCIRCEKQLPEVQFTDSELLCSTCKIIYPRKTLLSL